MRSISKIVLAAFLAINAFPAMARQAATNQAAKQLHELFDNAWEYEMQQDPVRAALLGDRRWNNRWQDLSAAAVDQRQQRRLDFLKRVRAIDRAALPAAEQLNYDLFAQEYQTETDEFQYRLHLAPLNQRGGVQTLDELTDLIRFQTVKDYEDWIARLQTLPALLDQTTDLMREGVRARVLLPKVVLGRVPAQIEKQIVADAQASPFYKPFKSFPASIAEAERERLTRDARDAISARVIPAYRKFKSYFEGEYLPASFDQVGVWQMPRGSEYYALAVRKFTTTELTPQQVHEIGLGEVKRIRGEMQKIMTGVGFTGSLAEFFKFLRTDPQFYYRTPDELLAAYRALAKRIDPEMVKLFKTLPRSPYGVVPIPDKIAPDTTAAYYNPPAGDGSRPGLYYVNLFKPEMRPKYEMMALSLHESVPGHHTQIAVAQELGEIPKFRRFGGYTAFIEGWGLYAESLGDDVNLYDDPYSKFGQLTYEMWRAVRLVVDTGMHHLRWDRQKAIDYFLDNAAKTELDVTNEIDRYIAWPGQALAYKIGELKIKSLRAGAQSQLKENFDLREFHDVVLGSGAVPLNVLERQVNVWVEQKKSRPSGTEGR